MQIYILRDLFHHGHHISVSEHDAFWFAGGATRVRQQTQRRAGI